MRFSLLTLLSATAALAAPSQVSEGQNLEARSNGVTHYVKVTQNGISPPQLYANEGDFIWFQFGFGMNSVVEGEYEQPCRSYGNGFASPSVYHSKGGYYHQVFVVDVPNTEPRWYYSGEDSRCTSGHVAVINPPRDGSKTLANYQARALRAPYITALSERGGQMEDDN
ncbi:putative GPI-anchored cupredoxin [Ceratocystis fimbriata CBS 114723]|uniref:Putative GPI-anchored cupredoxin n=1 Tax=Ceratocystis fimbriata CBS 114723 TaxID=1035309 RepID=A0A2C5XJQ5_9PEZI|nr:putative GPI-anchored cupredoxin [Ceratocystis fimbriata CBS 114723]